MMRVHRSNRTEALVEVLAEVVREPVGRPTEPECIVVQGRGMERWLSMELAKRLGVWANPDFPFPRRIVERALRAVLGEDDGARIFEPETLLWSVADVLPGLLARADFEAIRSYLAADDRGRKRFQLAERIANTFDHYTVYRPQMVLGWEDGRDSHWQAALWRTIVERHGAHHLARRSQTFLQLLQRGVEPAADFPRRLCLFGISTLPPLYLQVLGALCERVELHLFLLSPSDQYWADIRSRREIIREVLKHGDGGGEESGLHLAEGNPLLASLGRLGRDFQYVLEAESDYVEDSVDLYRDPGSATMLAAVQSDILTLRTRGEGDSETLPLVLEADDRSIAVHACHSPMREVEVLHDQLLAMFEEDPTLQPHDVVVMTPDINAYAPLIEAVFRPSTDLTAPMPHRIADRSLRVTSEVVDAFATILSALPGRMTASGLLDLLGVGVVRARFGIEASDLDLVRRWVTESGIRWGADAEHRAEVGQPPLPDNTWRFGLDRLFLGYALPGAGETLFEGVLPYDDVEGTSAQLLGRVADFCETLFRFRALPGQARPMSAWREELTKLLAAMVDEGKGSPQHQSIREALTLLEERANRAEFSGAVDFDTVRRQLEQELQRDPPSRGFLAGGMTFCELVPMRTIPFRVVCLLGMNDGSFPRVRRPLSFDLIARKPVRGDRLQRDDDRYLFLEALLSARDRFLITYVGQSITDNTPFPPSVVVSELLDTMGESFRIANEDSHLGEARVDAIVQRLVVRHPLQPFSPRYFRSDHDSRLFSFDRSQRNAAQAMCGPRRAAPELVSRPLPEGDDKEERVVDLDDLVRFFQNPSRFFLQRRLGIYLGKDVDAVSDREPLDLNALDRWKIGAPLLAAVVQGNDLEELFPYLRAEGQLPIGVLGDTEYEELRRQIEDIARSAIHAMGGDRLDAVEIDGDVDGTRIVGLLHPVFPNGLVDFTYSKMAPKYEVKLWLRHLLLNWARGPQSATLLARSGEGTADVVTYGPVQDAVELLQPLLRLYAAGRVFPVPFFPRTSYAYAKKRFAGGGDEPEALRAAATAHAAKFGDGEDAYVRQIYASIHPWERCRDGVVSFADATRAVLAPLFAHRQGAT